MAKKAFWHTEQEARKLWCPMARFLDSDGDVANRWALSQSNDLNPLPCRCIASECAMWRWNDEDETGYCGLAGRP